jgi:hypothetical protein
MVQIIEHRKFRRYTGEGFVVQIGQDIVEAMNISVAGIRVARPPAWASRRQVEFRLVPRIDTFLDMHQAVPVTGHVVGEGADHLRIAFASVNSALATIIGCHEGGGALPPHPVASGWGP